MKNSTTKDRILETALLLFATEGYDRVSIRNLADSVGIQPGSLYNHYKGKEDILQSCYNYFINHRHDNRLTKSEYTPIIKDGTKEEVINVLNYVCKEGSSVNMVYSLSIVFSRMYIDETATAICANEIKEHSDYAADFFNTGIKLGRFFCFNVPVVSWIYLSSIMFTALIKVRKLSEWRQIEFDIFKEFMKLVPFKY